MWSFHLKLAWRSLKQTPVVTLTSIVALAIGIAVGSCLTLTHHLASRDPISHKSSDIFNVRIDNWDPETPFFDVPPGDPPKSVSYQDMSRLLNCPIPTRQSGVGMVRLYVFPEAASLRPYQSSAQLVHSGFFPLFDAPFAYGGPWSPEADQERQRVVVLSHEANQKLFGGGDQVGRFVRLGNGDFQVVGILGPWSMTPKLYDPINGLLEPVLDFFVPFDHIRQQELAWQLTGDVDAWGFDGTLQGEQILTMGELNWIQLWVELPEDRRQAYAQFLDGYVADQKLQGRHPKPANNRIQPVMLWAGMRNKTARNMQVLVLLALAFLAVCAINLTGLLVAKFIKRAHANGIHRALGASRLQVFLQHLVECELVGLLGGVLGIALAWVGYRWIGSLLPAGLFLAPDMFTFHPALVLFSLAYAAASGLLAGLYPAWRACRIQPIQALKTL
jgi:putative ABC transport system permease protein